MHVAWEIILVQEVDDWLEELSIIDPQSANLVGSALNQLANIGPELGRPLVDSIKGSKIGNLKELRPGSTGRTEFRLLFVFDPVRQAVILVVGDKAGQWNAWYRENIPVAETRYAKWLAGDMPRKLNEHIQTLEQDAGGSGGAGLAR